MFSSKWLFFVEDPGALNYFIPVISYADEKQIPFVLVADNSALEYFRSSSVPVLTCDEFLLSSINYSIGLVGTSEDPGSFGLDLIRLLKDQGIPVSSIVDSSINSEYRYKGYSDNSLEYLPDYLFVPDERTCNSFIEMGFKSHHITIVGYPIQSNIKELQETSKEVARNLLNLSLPPERPLITFISEISNGLNSEQYMLSEQYSLFGFGNAKRRTDIVIEEIMISLDICLRKISSMPPFLSIRLHPKETEFNLSSYPCSFDYISKVPSDPYNLIIASDLVIGMSSMLLNEAFWLGARCLSVVPRRVECDWLPTVVSGDIPCVYHRSDLVLELESFFSTHISNSGSHSLNYNTERYRKFCPSTIFESPFANPREP